MLQETSWSDHPLACGRLMSNVGEGLVHLQGLLTQSFKASDGLEREIYHLGDIRDWPIGRVEGLSVSQSVCPESSSGNFEMDDDDGYLELDEFGNPIGADIVESDDDPTRNDAGMSFPHDPMSSCRSHAPCPFRYPTDLDAPSDDDIEADQHDDDPMADPNYVDDSAC